MPIDALHGRNILILGGSSGIGYATADYLLRSGSNVTICARTASKLESAKDRLLGETGSAPDRLRTMSLDAQDASLVEQAVAISANDAGELDGVFVVAGDASFVPVTRHTPDSVATEWRVNMYPLVNAITAAVPRMTRAGGSIVAVSSGAVAQSFPGLSAYGAAKAGLEYYVRVAADELGRHKIRVNAVQPGLTKSESSTSPFFSDETYLQMFDAMTPLGVYGLPRDLAPTVALLLSSETSWVTGQIIAIDGGLSLRGYGGRLVAPE